MKEKQKVVSVYFNLEQYEKLTEQAKIKKLPLSIFIKSVLRNCGDEEGIGPKKIDGYLLNLMKIGIENREWIKHIAEKLTEDDFDSVATELKRNASKRFDSFREFVAEKTKQK